MSDAGKNRGLATDSRLGLTDADDVEELDGRASFEMSIASLSEPDHSHAAMSDWRHEPVGTKGMTRHRCDAQTDVGAQRRRDILFEKVFFAEALVLFEQAGSFVGQRWILLPKGCHPRGAFFGTEFQRLVEAQTYGTPSIRTQLGHVSGPKILHPR